MHVHQFWEFYQVSTHVHLNAHNPQSDENGIARCAKNEDTNLDGKLDIVISYKKQVFCDKNGSESDKAIEDRSVVKTLLFCPNTKGAEWQLQQ